MIKEMQRSGKDILSFSLGEPDFDTPEKIRLAAVKAMNEGKTHYPPTAGIPELREAIAEKFVTDNGINVNGKQVIVTCGAKYAVYMVCQALLDPGDEVLLFDPAWVTYDACSRLAGANPNYISTQESDLIPQDVAEHVNSRTRMIIVNSPNNPSGAVYPRECLREIADIASDRDIWLLSDEVYEKIIYGGIKHYSLGSMVPEKTVTVNAFSKAYSMAGWRMGYIAAPEEIVPELLKLQSHSTSGITHFAQYGALTALRECAEDIEKMRREFEKRRDIVVNRFNEIGLPCTKPTGAFYAFPDVSSQGGGDATSERWLTDGGVGVTPGSAFGPNSTNYIRLSYAASEEDLRKGMDRITDVLV
jgi:aspartate aminotransferase